MKLHTLLKEGKAKFFNLSRESYCNNPLHGIVPAISEIFRKPLVRGASETIILSPLENVLLTSLFPLARNLMLSSALEVEIETSAEVAADLHPEIAGRNAAHLLNAIQQSFNFPVIFSIKNISEKGRGLRMHTNLKLAIPVKDLKPLYDEVYDDHNFTFLTSEPKELREVEGTNKCLISLNRASDEIIGVDAIIDGRMRGWAGEAVLAMNLMFGLYERTGLQLKAANY